MTGQYSGVHLNGSSGLGNIDLSLVIIAPKHHSSFFTHKEQVICNLPSETKLNETMDGPKSNQAKDAKKATADIYY